MDCKYLDCGCVVSCKEPGALVAECGELDCIFREWYAKHAFCAECGKCFACGQCSCPERFGI